MGAKKIEYQFEMDDNLFIQIKKYLQKNNLTLKQFCEKNNLDYYMTYKTIDRKIKMAAFQSFLDRLDTLTRK